MKDGETKKVAAKPVSERSKEEIHRLISENISLGVKIYTDDHRNYI